MCASQVEAEVRAAWSAVLAVDVTDETDFFAAGGDSLAALRVVERLAQTLGLDENVQSALLLGIFEQPTARGFGELTARLLAAEAR